MSNYFLYKHTAPNGKVYIGITKQVPQKRWLNGKGYAANEHFYNAIKKYGWNNIKHDILFSNLTKEEACKKEIELIAFYNSNNSSYGYNNSSGGENTRAGTSKYINKIFFNQFLIVDVNGDNLKIKCLHCDKTFERSYGCFNEKSKIKCPFEVHHARPIKHRYINYNGETRTLSEWSKILNISTGTIISREKRGLDIAKGKCNVKNCAICGKPFKAKDKQSKYCSKQCHYEGLRGVL